MAINRSARAPSCTMLVAPDTATSTLSFTCTCTCTCTFAVRPPLGPVRPGRGSASPSRPHGDRRASTGVRAPENDQHLAEHRSTIRGEVRPAGRGPVRATARPSMPRRCRSTIRARPSCAEAGARDREARTTMAAPPAPATSSQAAPLATTPTDPIDADIIRQRLRATPGHRNAQPRTR